MNWKIDDISFSDYGVFVESSSGVLDMPGLDIDSHDWIDSDGLEVRETVKKKKSEIILRCWIRGNSFSDFKIKVDTFFGALTSPDLRVLKSDFIPDGIEVYTDRRIRVSRLTGWNKEKQIGTFNLRLTVPGDPDYYLLDIKREYDDNIVATVKTDNLKIHKTLQGEVYAACTFETGKKLDIQFFDHIRIMSNGNNTDIFHIETEPTFKKFSNNRYVYNVRFEHQINWLLHASFLNDRKEADFYHHANVQEIIELIVANHNREWWDNFVVGSIAHTERRYHKFNGESCSDVLKRICSEYNLEYEFEYVGPSKYRINVQEKVANDTGITFQYGKEKGLFELSRERALTDELCTILYAFGSSKNLKPDYRQGIGRLSFDGNPLKNNSSLTIGWGPREKVEYFEDIYPRRTGNVTSYTQILPEDLLESQKYAYPEGIYKLVDATLDFDINEFLLGGLTAKIKMKTGDLAGYEFEIARYDHVEREIYIIPFKDERGMIFPNETLTISVNDEYTLIDIDQPANYVTEAENELAQASADYMAKYSILRFIYRCRIDPKFLKDNNIGGFEVGDRIYVVDSDYGINGEFRISRLTFDVNTQMYDLELSDLAHLTKKQKNELRLKSVERAVADTGMNEVPSMRKSKRTVEELKNKLVDPVDDKLNTDRNIRDESIDPRMLAYDSGVPQISLKNALVECNVDGDEDAVKVGAGQLVMHNFAEKTLSRWEIKKLKEMQQTYDPTREWEILETTFQLPTKGGYWLYAKLNMADLSTECTLEVFQEHKEVKELVDIELIRYKLGYISDATSPRTASMLFGNVKYNATGNTRYSIVGDGTPINPVQLENDEEIPAPLKYYGTNELGIRGFNPVPEVSFEALNAKGDVGSGSDQLAVGDHDHEIGDMIIVFENGLI